MTVMLMEHDNAQVVVRVFKFKDLVYTSRHVEVKDIRSCFGFQATWEFDRSQRVCMSSLSYSRGVQTQGTRWKCPVFKLYKMIFCTTLTPDRFQQVASNLSHLWNWASSTFKLALTDISQHCEDYRRLSGLIKIIPQLGGVNWLLNFSSIPRQALLFLIEVKCQTFSSVYLICACESCICFEPWTKKAHKRTSGSKD